MEITSTQIPHQFRNRFLRDGDSYMMTTGGTASGGGGSFTPHYVWGVYDDGQTDIVGDFVTSGNITADASLSIGGNASVGGYVYVGGDLKPLTNASSNLGSSSKKWQNVYSINSSVINLTATNLTVSSTMTSPTITDIYDQLQALADLIEDVSSRVGNSSSS